MILKAARETGIEFTVPLHLLNPYWALDVLMPMKRRVELLLKRNEMSKVIIKLPADTKEYSLDVIGN